MSQERWLPVVGYEGLYEISDHGRLRRIKSGIGVPRTGIPLVPCDNNGYRQYTLHDGKQAVIAAHRLVADAFLGPRPPGLQVNHKNLDKADNRAENLEYVSCADNVRHSIERQGRNSPRGESHPNAKLTETKVRTIRRIYPRWGWRVLAQRFGVSEGAIQGVLERKNWKHVPDDGPIIESILREATEEDARWDE